MIVCVRCGYENEAGRNLCGRCRAYLGWSTIGARHDGRTTSPADAPPADDTNAEPPPAKIEPTGTRQALPAPQEDAAIEQRADAGHTAARDDPPDPPRNAHRKAEASRVVPREVRPAPPPAARHVAPTTIAPAPIPTVVADTPARFAPVEPPLRAAPAPSGHDRFGAVRPDGSRPDRGTAQRRAAAPHPSSVLPADGHGLLSVGDDANGAQRCPSCGVAVPASKRFCRCGATLAPTTSLDLDDHEEIRVPWYRRMADGAGGRAAFWKAMRAANDGSRASFNRARSLRQTASEGLAVLAAIGIGASQLGPWGEDLRSTVWEQVRDRMPVSYSSVEITGAKAEPPLPAEAGFEPQRAVDRDTGTAWARPWTQPPADQDACKPTLGTDRLVLTLGSLVRVDRLRVAAGLPKVAFDRNRQPRPRVLAITLSDGSCVERSLEESTGLQVVMLDGVETTSITIAVVDVYPGDANAVAPTPVAITEVLAERR